MSQQVAETWPFKVRSGFTLRIGKRILKGGEVIDLTEQQAFANKHMVEPAPDQIEVPEGKPKVGKRDR